MINFKCTATHARIVGYNGDGTERKPVYLHDATFEMGEARRVTTIENLAEAPVVGSVYTLTEVEEPVAAVAEQPVAEPGETIQ